MRQEIFHHCVQFLYGFLTVGVQAGGHLPQVRSELIVQAARLQARPHPQDGAQPLSVSVIIPARNESGNIEAAFQRVPHMGSHTEFAELLHPALPIRRAQVIWAVREEMARTVDDVLARRTRALYLNSRAALAMVPAVARLMAQELGRDQAWEQRQLADFQRIAVQFTVES